MGGAGVKERFASGAGRADGRLRAHRRIVVKVGSSLLVDPATGLKHGWLATLAADIAAHIVHGGEAIMVSSGAIALGRSVLGMPRGPLRLEESQGAAAVGQIALARAWSEALGAHHIAAGQILVTLGDTEERRRYLNARSTMQTLLKLGAVPVINENDTVATTEIRYGDNDRLAARIATMMSADCLVLLSDVDGLYTAPPASSPDARFVETVEAVTPEIEAMAGSAGSELSRGGMLTKIEAAKIATSAGTAMVIGSGHVAHPLAAIDAGGKATWFRPHGDPIAARKRWIAGALEPRGTMIVDDGAARALQQGKSLLPAGVRAVEGRFARGDAVIIRDTAGREIGRGLSAYDCVDAGRIIGRNSREIFGILGYAGRAEMVHRDDLTLKKT
ncbi:glutamate 5-kinase [Microbaculum marinum]|uniref:Glutamate 5-kinase n=1 Tax=Microbaculum marinum TaxID=1764581 RepID=A0AAW9RJE7_9HYPH